MSNDLQIREKLGKERVEFYESSRFVFHFNAVFIRFMFSCRNAKNARLMVYSSLRQYIILIIKI